MNKVVVEFTSPSESKREFMLDGPVEVYLNDSGWFVITNGPQDQYWYPQMELRAISVTDVPASIMSVKEGEY